MNDREYGFEFLTLIFAILTIVLLFIAMWKEGCYEKLQKECVVKGYAVWDADKNFQWKEQEKLNEVQQVVRENERKKSINRLD